MLLKTSILTILTAFILAHTLIQCTRAIEHRRGDYVASGTIDPSGVATDDQLATDDGYLDRDLVLVYIDEKKNSFSSSLKKADIKYLASTGTRHIIRLNGDGKDAGHLSRSQERELCEKLGIKYTYFNIEGQVETIGHQVADLMAAGGVNVHCKNGAHRAPAMAAFYLRSIKMKRGEVIELVGWADLIQDPGEYWRYIEHAIK
jgi:protein tyrosine phosphatase (PTP) superfamily phosphohydrolase (DUF442 family)